MGWRPCGHKTAADNLCVSWRPAAVCLEGVREGALEMPRGPQTRGPGLLPPSAPARAALSPPRSMSVSPPPGAVPSQGPQHPRALDTVFVGGFVSADGRRVRHSLSSALLTGRWVGTDPCKETGPYLGGLWRNSLGSWRRTPGLTLSSTGPVRCPPYLSGDRLGQDLAPTLRPIPPAPPAGHVEASLVRKQGRGSWEDTGEAPVPALCP